MSLIGLQHNSAGILGGQTVDTGKISVFPSGFTINVNSVLTAGSARISLAGVIPGKSFNAASSFTKASLVGTIVAAPVKSISLSPANPGTLGELSAGAGTQWTTTVTLNNLTNFSWMIIKADGTQRGATTVVPVNGSKTITVPFAATGDKLRVIETGNPAVVVDSGTVTITQISRSITLDPKNPGNVSVAFGSVSTKISTVGITNFTLVVVNADYSWTSTGYSFAVNAAGDSKTIDIIYGYNGQFLKVFDTNDASFYVDGDPVTIGGTTGSDPGTTPATFFEDFSNNNSGQLNNTWGETSGVSYSGGVMRIGGNTNPAGVMGYAGGEDWWFGYGTYEIRWRMTGNAQGPAIGLWAADNSWPRGEEDMGELDNGGLYFAHHFDGGGGENRFEIFRANGADWTQWHTSKTVLRHNFLEFFLDNVSLGSTTNNVTPVYADGGVNRTFFIMNTNPNTAIYVDWIRFTAD